MHTFHPKLILFIYGFVNPNTISQQYKSHSIKISLGWFELGKSRSATEASHFGSIFIPSYPVILWADSEGPFQISWKCTLSLSGVILDLSEREKFCDNFRISGRSFGPNFGFPYTFCTFSLLSQVNLGRSVSLGRLFLPNHPLGWPLLVYPKA